MTPSAATTPRAATNHMVTRQPNAAPSAVPIGTLRAEPTVVPPKTMDSARPRCSGATRVAAVTLAVGTNSAAPTAVTTQPPSARPNVGASAVATLPTTNTAREAVSKTRRGHRPVAAASTGAHAA